MSISDSQQKREAVVEDFRTIRLSSGRNFTEDTPQTAVTHWAFTGHRNRGFSQEQTKHYDDSDVESHGSEDELLERAGVWTVEEAHRILRDKMKKLQKLYSLQMKHLHMEYKIQRRKYLLDKDLLQSKAASGPSYMRSEGPPLVPHTNNSHYQDYKVYSSRQISRELLIKAKTRQCLRQYCKRRGIDAVLHRKQQARKQQHTLSLYQRQSQEARSNNHRVMSKINHLSEIDPIGLPSEELPDLDSLPDFLREHKLQLEKGRSGETPKGQCQHCDDLCLPLTLYCKEHVVKECTTQLVYTYCSHVGCKRVVIEQEDERCLFHPPILDILPKPEPTSPDPPPVLQPQPILVDSIKSEI